MNAITSNGYKKPRDDQYKNLLTYATKLGFITCKRELAMFLANSIQETAGLTLIEEKISLTGKNPKDYDMATWTPPPNQNFPAPGKSGKYYGRGYLQLSYPSNYFGASQGLYGDDRLWKNPELVSKTEELAWKSAFWFWGNNVHKVWGNGDRPEIQNGQFGFSIFIINGERECQNPSEAARNRFTFYKKVLLAFGVNEVADGSGCNGNVLNDST